MDNLILYSKNEIIPLWANVLCDEERDFVVLTWKEYIKQYSSVGNLYKYSTDRLYFIQAFLESFGFTLKRYAINLNYDIDGLDFVLVMGTEHSIAPIKILLES